MDGAFGRNPDIAIEPPHQELADLARAPVRLLGLEADDQALQLKCNPCVRYKMSPMSRAAHPDIIQRLRRTEQAVALFRSGANGSPIRGAWRRPERFMIWQNHP